MPSCQRMKLHSYANSPLGLVFAPASARNLFHYPQYSLFVRATRAVQDHNSAMTLTRDEDLMLEVRDGAGETLGVLFDRYQTPLFNFYSKMTGDRILSEDLVQEVFLRILKYRQSYTPGTPFRSWMYQIARNARLDHFRKQRPETSWSAEMEPR